MALRTRTAIGLRPSIAPVVAIAIASAVAAGCSSAEQPASSRAVGPAPLRRMTDGQYVNALADLFPTVHVDLPTLPKDVTVAGFDNAAEAQEPSDVRIARYETIANLYADALTRDRASVSALVGCDDWSTPDLASSCATQFVLRTGRRVFRRPVDDAERDRFSSRFHGWAQAVDFEAAVRLTLSAMLQSPQFLYRAEPLSPALERGAIVAVEPFAMASRLSFLLWESVPDDALLDAAARDELASAEQVRAHATRMLADPRAKRVLWSFPRQWLGLDRILQDEHVARSQEVDPAWTQATQLAASEETRLFVENVLAGGGTFRDLMTSPRAWTNGETARLYGLPAPADPNAWTEVTLPREERAGLLTRASFLAGFSHAGATSPPVRGNGIQLRLLCQLPISPPPGVDLSQPRPEPGQGPATTRMLFEARTAPATCQSCHASLNGFGFGFENFDAAGRFRAEENGLPIDASGHIHGTDVDGEFVGPLALSSALASSKVVHACATERLVRYALGRAPAPVERSTVDDLTRRFTATGGDVRALLTDIATSPSVRLRKVEDE